MRRFFSVSTEDAPKPLKLTVSPSGTGCGRGAVLAGGSAEVASEVEVVLAGGSAVVDWDVVVVSAVVVMDAEVKLLSAEVFDDAASGLQPAKMARQSARAHRSAIFLIKLLQESRFTMIVLVYNKEASVSTNFVLGWFRDAQKKTGVDENGMTTPVLR